MANKGIEEYEEEIDNLVDYEGDDADNDKNNEQPDNQEPVYVFLLSLCFF